MHAMNANVSKQHNSAPPKKNRKPLVWGGVGAAVLTGLLGSAMAVSFSANDGRLANNVVIDGQNVGGLTGEEALQKLQSSVAPRQLTVNLAGQSWKLSGEKIGWKRDFSQALAEAEKYTAEQSMGERLQGLWQERPPVEWKSSSSVQREQVEQLLRQVAQPLEVAPEDGELKYNAREDRYEVVGGKDGKKADLKRAIAELEANPDAEALDLQLLPQETAASPASLQRQADSANALLRPFEVKLSDGGRSAHLTAGQVANLFDVTANGIVADEEAIKKAFDGLVRQLDRAPSPARYVRQGGVLVPREGKMGHQVEQSSAWNSFKTDVLNASNSSSTWLSHNSNSGVTAAELPDPEQLELVASGWSTYDGSSAARRTNIKVAGELIDGYVVPTDGVFSFLDAVGSIDRSNGFVDGLIISGGETVDGLGGGVCQVSTTAFRALYNAGLPIVERHSHSYRVPYYEPQTGFEAAVYDPGLDLKMKNDTGAPLLVRVKNDDANSRMVIELWGKRPDREVHVSDAVITQRFGQPATRSVRNANLRPGTSRQVAGGRGGMYMYITRTITENGQSRSERLETRYEPRATVIEHNR